MIPLMGFCYMLQYMDKLAISQATLLGLRQDLVRDDTNVIFEWNPLTDGDISGPPWYTIFLVFRYLLLRISYMEFTVFISHCVFTIG